MSDNQTRPIYEWVTTLNGLINEMTYRIMERRITKLWLEELAAALEGVAKRARRLASELSGGE